MGHWSESLVDEVASMVGADPIADRDLLVDLLGKAEREIDVMAGRSFVGVRQATSSIDSNGLPFVDVPDVHVDSVGSATPVWAIPDPVNPTMASVLQLVAPNSVAGKACSVADALRIAGHLVARASKGDLLTTDHVLHWIGSTVQPEERTALLRRIMNPEVRYYVPLMGIPIQGWWVQISRRLRWMTTEFPDDGRLVELLLGESRLTEDGIALAADEPILIVTPMTHHPVEWAFVARIWPENALRPVERPWKTLAPAIHGHGIPAITVDRSSTEDEVACQMVLKGFWHGYVSPDESGLARAVERAFPQAVERIRRHTDAADTPAAATMLLERLMHPGFDPARGAEATRRYVRRMANIAVLEHRKRTAPERCPWTHVGISERRFYKLLPLFATKVNGRYQYDFDDVVERMRAHLDSCDRAKEVRAAAMDVLLSRGFKSDAARKWLQRHPPEEAITAWPRGSAPSSRK